MNDSKELISDEVVSTAKRIEDTDDYDELDPLEIKVEAGIDGNLREIILVLTTGGPHIELYVRAKKVRGWWGGESHDCPIFNSEEMLEELDHRYASYWDEVIRA